LLASSARGGNGSLERILDGHPGTGKRNETNLLMPVTLGLAQRRSSASAREPAQGVPTLPESLARMVTRPFSGKDHQPPASVSASGAAAARRSPLERSGKRVVKEDSRLSGDRDFSQRTKRKVFPLIYKKGVALDDGSPLPS